MNYCLKNDVVIYSPESSGERTYRAVLAEVINSIWEQSGEVTRVVDRSAESISNGLSKLHQEAMEKAADTCEHFQAPRAKPAPEILPRLYAFRCTSL